MFSILIFSLFTFRIKLKTNTFIETENIYKDFFGINKIFLLLI